MGTRLLPRGTGFPIVSVRGSFQLHGYIVFAPSAGTGTESALLKLHIPIGCATCGTNSIEEEEDCFYGFTYFDLLFNCFEICSALSFSKTNKQNAT